MNSKVTAIPGGVLANTDLSATNAQAEAKIVVKHPDGAETKSSELVGKPKVFAEKPCEVAFGAGHTHNLGNYSSARFEVRISVPCAHTEIDAVYDFARKWVDSRMTALVESLPKG